MKHSRKICFANAGVMELESLTVMGLSAKLSDNPIGFFGTGLKYAIATLLRNGAEVKLYLGLQELKFKTEKSTFRGEEINVVWVGDRQLPYTATLGKNWSLQDAFRELYCNMLDEESPRYYNGDALSASGYTTIEVLHNEFAEIKPSDIMLETPCLQSCSDIAVHAKQQQAIYNKGVLACRIDQPMMYTYNLVKGVVLTEDRTIKSPNNLLPSFGQFIWRKCTDEEMIRNILTAPRPYFESDFQYGIWEEPTEAFNKVMLDLIENSYNDINKNAVNAYLNYKPDARVIGKLLEPSDLQMKTILKALDLCARIGFDINNSGYTVRVCTDLGIGILGMADSERKIIYVTEKAIDKGVRELMLTFIEEYIHIKHDVNDESRAMQNVLFDYMLSAKLELIGEVI